MRWLSILLALLLVPLCAGAEATTPEATFAPRPTLTEAALEALRARMDWRYAWQDRETGLVLYEAREEAANGEAADGEAGNANETGGLYGLADIDGAPVFPRLYADPFEFSEGVALVRYEAYFAYLLPDGSVLSDGWTYAQPFENGRARVQRDDWRGTIDHSGREEAEP